MVFFRPVALLALALASSASASFEAIAGYEPLSIVTDHNAIDKDQALIESLLATGTTQSIQQAKDVYEKGAFSKTVATVTVSPSLATAIAKGTKLSGKTADGTQVDGTLFEAYTANSGTLRFQYEVNSKQAQYVNCQVGANPDPNIEGCLATSGTLAIEGSVDSITYSYSQTTGNTNERTIRGFSTGAKAKMNDCDNCPYPMYEKFYNYYGEFDYADKWVQAAFALQKADFTNGDADFSLYGEAGQAQAVKKGTAYMNVWMYVLRNLEHALDNCKEGCSTAGCNDGPVHSWDEGVAFYTGSLEGQDGAGSGVMPYALADKRCVNFKTCGDLADALTGTSHVNIEVFRYFKLGVDKLNKGECAAARSDKEEIETLMLIPLVQGTIRYSYIVDTEEDAGESTKAEVATFAAAVLPAVHACSEADAQVIYDNTKVGATATDFKAVKSAFESQYECMKIDGKHVGGLWDYVTGDYYDGAGPGPAGVATTSTLLAIGAAGVAALSMLF
mmetsp:Transcript_17619/g.49856  ORF Transcript_17619/g.49856 Transcript_17619/m.49856 type:complete len:503 (-) Transcript_17619:120-1628(-)